MSDDKDPHEEAIRLGRIVRTPKPNELFIDMIDILNQERSVEWTHVTTPSPSGRPHHFHVVVTMDRDVRDEFERLGLQAMLGSDRKREALCWLRAENRLEPVTCFFETPEFSPPVDVAPAQDDADADIAF